MIITWFTQPANSYASYYQFDTETKKFVRIRMELGRKSGSGRTQLIYEDEYAVGFGKAADYDTSDAQRWKVNEKGQLCYDDKPLSLEPGPKLNTFDTKQDYIDNQDYVHFGNELSTNPSLPDGIEPKHLSLLASDAMEKGKSYRLTERDASGKELSDKIKSKVCDVMDVDTSKFDSIDKAFKSITDETILEKLKDQVKNQKAAAAERSKERLDVKLEEVKKAVESIGKEITNGTITPNEEFTKAVEKLGTSVEEALKSSNSSELAKITEHLSSASTAVATAIDKIDAAKHASTKTALEESSKALEAAATENEAWTKANAEFSKLEASESVKSFEENMVENDELKLVTEK